MNEEKTGARAAQKRSSDAGRNNYSDPFLQMHPFHCLSLSSSCTTQHPPSFEWDLFPFCPIFSVTHDTHRHNAIRMAMDVRQRPKCPPSTRIIGVATSSLSNSRSCNPAPPTQLTISSLLVTTLLCPNITPTNNSFTEPPHFRGN